MTESENPGITTEQQITTQLKSNNVSADTQHRGESRGNKRGENTIGGRLIGYTLYMLVRFNF